MLLQPEPKCSCKGESLLGWDKMMTITKVGLKPSDHIWSRLHQMMYFKSMDVFHVRWSASSEFRGSGRPLFRVAFLKRPPHILTSTGPSACPKVTNPNRVFYFTFFLFYLYFFTPTDIHTYYIRDSFFISSDAFKANLWYYNMFHLVIQVFMVS